MDYNIDLDALASKHGELNGLSSEAEDAYDIFNTGYLSDLAGTEIAALSASIRNGTQRLARGYSNSESWFKRYLDTLNETEEYLSDVGSNGEVLAFKSAFADVFSKSTMPTLKTGFSFEDIEVLDEEEIKTLLDGKGLTDEQIEELIKIGETQKGLPYNSMHYGPTDGDKQGFGCAMFVSYCFNNLLFDGASGQTKDSEGFYGSCMNYWGNCTNDNYDAHNKGFVEVSASEAKRGDIICFVNGEKHNTDDHARADNCYHVGIYLGDGRMLHSSSYSDGVGEISISKYLRKRNNGNDYYFIRYVGDQT